MNVAEKHSICIDVRVVVKFGAESSTNHMCCFMRVLYTQFTDISRTNQKCNERITFWTCYVLCVIRTSNRNIWCWKGSWEFIQSKGPIINILRIYRKHCVLMSIVVLVSCICSSLKCLLFLIETLLDQGCQHITVAGTDT